MTRNETYGIDPFMDGSYLVEIDEEHGRYLIFQEPKGENGDGVIQGRVAGEKRLYRFWKKKSWRLPNGRKSRWYGLTDGNLLGETHNFSIIAEVEVNDDGMIEHFHPKEFQILVYDPTKGDKGQVPETAKSCSMGTFVPTGFGKNSVPRRVLKNHNTLADLAETKADDQTVEM